MTDSLQNRVLGTIGRHSMIRPGDRVGVGISGGADSVALLRLLFELKAKLGIAIFALHFHHQLRGAEADEDEQFVEELAGKFGVDFVKGRADVAGEARRRGLNVEDAARRLRYQFFASSSASRKLNRVAVAHTMDDQAETVLAHLLRGTGLAGLAGIYPVCGPVAGPVGSLVAALLIRPLIEIRREELREYLSGLGQAWREDASNQDTTRMRARIRHKLVPMLQRDFDSSTVIRLARLANLSREEETFWNALEENRLAALTAREPSGAISIGIPDLLSPQPEAVPTGGGAGSAIQLPTAATMALTRRLLRRIVAELRGSRQQLTAQHIQDVIDLATKSQSGAYIELPGVVVQLNFERLIFFSRPADLDSGQRIQNSSRNHEFEYTIELPALSEAACIVVPEIGRRFRLKMIDWPAGSGETTSDRGTLDFDRLRWPLVLRNWHPGDSFRPYGRKRVRKLKRLFLESRVPRSIREGWPVLTSEGRLVWASGYCVADEFSPGPNTRTAVTITEEGC